MEEKVLTNKKHGMLVLLLTTVLYVAAVGGCVFGGMTVSRGGSAALLVISIVWLCIGWFPYCGLKVLKPQEAFIMSIHSVPV